jgi:hypothetical protein
MYRIGAVLSQEYANNDGKPQWHPIAYYLAMLPPTERNYNIYERELLAIIKVLQHW